MIERVRRRGEWWHRGGRHVENINVTTFAVWYTTVIFTIIFKSDFKQEDNHIKKTIVGYLPRRGPKGILGVNTIITEEVEEAMTKGRDQWGNNGRTKVTGETKNKPGVSTEETEKLYNS